MKTKWKVIIGVLAVIAIAGVALYSTLRPLQADTETVSLRDLTRSFTEEGTVVPREEYALHSLSTGEVINLFVEEGDRVAAGDLLVQLDVSELDYQIRQLRAQLRSLQGEEAGVYTEPYEASVSSQELQITLAEQNLETAETHYQRMEALYQSGAVSAREFEEASEMLDAAETNLQLQQEALNLLFQSHSPAAGTQDFYQGRAEALRAQIDLMEYQKEKGKLYAPLSGTIAEVNVKSGQPASPGLPLMKIFSADDYEVSVDILSEDVLHVSEGMEVELIQNRQGQEFVFRGIVSRIAPTAVETVSVLGLEEQRVKITIQPKDPGEALLFPGIRLDARFVTDHFEGVIALRKTLVFPYEDGDAVWVVEDGRAQVRPVVTGPETDREVIIESGLQEGDVLILNPQLDGLDKGTRVN